MAAQELSLAWNNQKAVPDLQGGTVKEVQNAQWVQMTKKAVRKGELAGCREQEEVRRAAV